MTRHQLKRIRKALGMTQPEFAQALGFGHIMIGYMECGTRAIQKTTELAVVGLLFQLTRTDLIATCGVTNPKEAHHGPHEWDFQPIE